MAAQPPSGQGRKRNDIQNRGAQPLSMDGKVGIIAPIGEFCYGNVPIFAVADAYEIWRDLDDQEVMHMIQSAS
jgi:hypothetical protein